MRNVSLVVVGGAVGTLARFGVAESVSHGTVFPYATFGVNILGSFLLGLLVASLLHRQSDPMRLLLGTGFLGGFTTYSALAVETEALLRGNHVALGVSYAAASVVIGLAAAITGMALGSRSRA